MGLREMERRGAEPVGERGVVVGMGGVNGHEF